MVWNIKIRTVYMGVPLHSGFLTINFLKFQVLENQTALQETQKLQGKI